MAYPMGEAKLEPLRVDFDRRLKLEFHGSDISSDAGLLPYLPRQLVVLSLLANGRRFPGNRGSKETLSLLLSV